VTRVLAISDLHVNYRENWSAIAELPPCPDDWLVLAGDIGERMEHLAATLELLRPRYRGIVWVPGNHELWTRTEDGSISAPAKYRRLVELCRSLRVLTPEDEYPVVHVDDTRYRLVPLFLLYDYSFRPPEITSRDAAIEWAGEAGIMCADELLLTAAPFPSREAWCHERVAYSRSRLDELRDERLILINHYPLREDLAVLPAIPRFALWCGTTLTEDWHTRYSVEAVVYGHLHRRTTTWRQGVRFEEVSLGKPSEWDRERPASAYVRQIVPCLTPPNLDIRH